MHTRAGRWVPIRSYNREGIYLSPYKEKDLGAETLSAMVFLSPGYLSAVFKRRNRDDTEPFYP